MSIATRKREDKDLIFLWSELNPNRERKPRTGEIRARSEEHARYQLSRQGLKNVSIKKVRQQASSSINLLQVSAFVRQLAVMMQSSVPLGQALGLIANAMKARNKRNLQTVVRTIRSDVESGQKLSDAMRKHPRCFDTLFCNTLAAGEAAGELESTLDRLATHLEKIVRMRQKIKKAMVYPSLVIIVAIAVTVGMLMFVLPSFKSVYSQFKAELPALTSGLLAASDTLTEHGWIVLACVTLGLVVFVQVYKRNDVLRDYIDRILLRTPIFGEIIKTAIHARWTRTFSTLSGSGVPITSALDSVAGVTKIKSYRQAILRVRQVVTTGGQVSEAMDKESVFPPEAVQMIRIGEESGRLDSMLEKLAGQYETKLDDHVETLSTIMEPLVMCIIGGLVGILIVGMYLPIFKLGSIF